jgi:Domain of unknown function (DUF892)
MPTEHQLGCLTVSRVWSEIARSIASRRAKKREVLRPGNSPRSHRLCLPGVPSPRTATSKLVLAIDKKPQGKTCDAIVGITDEGAEIMKEYKGSPALDAGLLAAAQAVEHYEISRYGTLKTWANELGLGDAVGLLDQTLAEEKKTDATLTEIAESIVNREAEAA